MNKEEAKEELEKNKKYVSGCFDDEHCEESFNEGIDVAIKIIEKVESSQQKKSVKKIVSEVNKLRTYTIEEECFEVDLILKSAVLKLLDQLDQPKLVVPKFVIDWVNNSREADYEFEEWFYYSNQPSVVYEWVNSENKRQSELNALALMTLIVNGPDAVTVEKEKLYTVKIPDPNSKDTVYCLFKDEDGQVKIGSVLFLETELDESWRDDPDMQLTEQEIRKDFD